MSQRVLGIPLWGFVVIGVGAFVALSVTRAANGGRYWRSTPIDDSAANARFDTATAISQIVTGNSGATIPYNEAAIGQNPTPGRVG